MADSSWVCWRCSASVAELPLPLARLAECPRCRAELHVCRMCEFYDRSYAHACRETIADEVQNKERANFCGYFTLRPGAFVAETEALARHARAELDAVFGNRGESRNTAADALAELERLFGGKKGP